MIEDLKFISGKFFLKSLNKEHLYFKRYFKTKIQKSFLVYYLMFRTCHRFKEHSGINIQSRYLRILKRRFNIIEKVYLEANKNLDFELVSLINGGKYFRNKKRIFRNVINV